MMNSNLVIKAPGRSLKKGHKQAGLSSAKLGLSCAIWPVARSIGNKANYMAKTVEN